MIYVLEMLVFLCFSVDIIINFMRLPVNIDDESDRKHSVIAKKYVSQPRFYIDALATFPFFLIKIESSDGEQSNLALFFKLLRLARIPRLIRIMDIEKFSQMCDCFFSGKARGRRVLI